MHLQIETQPFRHNFIALPYQYPSGLYQTINQKETHFFLSKGQKSTNNSLQLSYVFQNLLSIQSPISLQECIDNIPKLKTFTLYASQSDYVIIQLYYENIISQFMNQVEIIYSGMKFPIFYSGQSYVIFSCLFDLKGPQRITPEAEIKIEVQQTKMNICKKQVLYIEGDRIFSLDQGILQKFGFCEKKADIPEYQIQIGKQLKYVFGCKQGDWVTFEQDQKVKALEFENFKCFEEQDNFFIGLFGIFQEKLLDFFKDWLNFQLLEREKIYLYTNQYIVLNKQKYQIFLVEKFEHNFKIEKTIIINKSQIIEYQIIKNIKHIDQLMLQQIKGQAIDFQSKTYKNYAYDKIFDIFYKYYKIEILECIKTNNIIYIKGESNMLKTQFIKHIFKNTLDFDFQYINLKENQNNPPKFQNLKQLIKNSIQNKSFQNKNGIPIICIDNSDNLLNLKEDQQESLIILFSKQLKVFFKKYSNCKFIIILNNQTKLNKILEDYPHYNIQFERKNDLKFWQIIQKTPQKLPTGEYLKLYENFLINQNYQQIDAKPIKIINFNRIGGLKNQKCIFFKLESIIDTFQIPLKYCFLLENVPIKLSQGILLYGPPGCGKTLLAKATANELNINFLVVKGPELLNKYIGASEQAVRDLFEQAQSQSPCILFFDEFDSLVPKRAEGSTGVTDRVVNQFLCYLDGVTPLKQVYILAATSRPDMIDPALLRPGRIDTHVFIGLPTFEERVEILSKILSESQNFEVDVQKIAQLTQNFISADIVQLLKEINIQKAQYLVQNKNLMEENLNIEIQNLDKNLLKINQQDVETAIINFRPSLSLQVLKNYDNMYFNFKNKSVDISQQKTTMH